MRKTIHAAALMALIGLIVGLSGCLLEDREVEIVLNDENCEEFVEYRISEEYTDPYLLDVVEEIDSLLADNDLTRSDIVDAFLVSAAYTVIEFEQEHPWDLFGVITVERVGSGLGPDTLLDYNDGVAISAEVVGDKTYVTLHDDGVAVVNQALDDFIAGGNPVLRIVVENGDVDPSPSLGDPLDFIWEFCLYIQVITSIETEVYEPL